MTASAPGRRRRASTPVSPPTAAWLATVPEATSGPYGIQVDTGDGWDFLRVRRRGWSQVGTLDRGSEVIEMEGRDEYAERYYVLTRRWSVYSAPSWLRQHLPWTWVQGDIPRSVPAPGGPLTVGVAGDRIEVIADGRVVARFCGPRGAALASAIAFTHYGYVPVGLLLAELDKPIGDSVLRQRVRIRDAAPERAAVRIRTGMERLMAAERPRGPEAGLDEEAR